MPLPITRGALSARGFGLFSAPAALATDPYFPYVTMLLHGDGTNGAQNNTFLDSSTNNFSITRNGNTTQGSFSPYGSNWSNYFGGVSGNYLAPQSATSSVAFGTGNFTFECWLNADSTSGNNFVLDARSSSSQNNLCFLIQSGSWLWQYAGTNIISTASGMITVGTWNHVAFVRNSGTLSLYVNGSLITSVSDSTNYAAAAAAGRPGIAGGGFNTTEIFKGYISNLRIVVGTAVYTSAFTPSTTPLTAITNTSLLTCQSNRFIDNSTNAFAITVNGTPSVQRFSPFSPSAAYSTSVIGGSGYFDGSGDYLTIPANAVFNMGTGDFTWEAWVLLPNNTSDYSLYTGTANGDMDIRRLTDGTLRIGRINTAWDSTSSALSIANQWTHLAVSRSGSTLKMFANGVQVFSGTNTNSYNITTNVTIGQTTSSAFLTGYMSNARLTKGGALYTAAFTPPTSPVTTSVSAGTVSMLLNFTNGGIIDNAMMNDLETVGNAQISTSVVKYGTGSLYFDGTDDRLPMPASPNFAFGTGDFTVEYWLYSNDVSSAQRGMLQTSATTGGISTSYADGIAMLQGINAANVGMNGGLGANVGGTFITSNTVVLTTGTWYHIAMTRASGTVRIFVNGNLHVSGTAAGNCTGQNLVVGGYYSTAYLYNGYIDDLRITKGYARYTANFTPPTVAFPNQ